jgi:hypothetical protein
VRPTDSPDSAPGSEQPADTELAGTRGPDQVTGLASAGTRTPEATPAPAGARAPAGVRAPARARSAAGTGMLRRAAAPVSGLLAWLAWLVGLRSGDRPTVTGESRSGDVATVTGEPRRGRRPDASARGRVGEAAGLALARLTVLPAVLVVAWLIPGLPLLLGGDFLPVPMLLISVPLAAALTVNGLRAVPAAWPRLGARDRAAPGWTTWFGLLTTVAVVVGLTAWQLRESSESVIVLRDAGTYLQAGYWIAQHGSLAIPQSLSAFGGAHHGLSFASIGFLASGSSVTPAVTSGMPMLLAAGFWAHGLTGAGAVGPILGGLAELSFAGLIARLVGPQWAPAGALVLGLSLPQQYVSRSTLGETALQVVLFGGLCLLADSLTLRAVIRAARPAPPARPAPASPAPPASAATPAGAAAPAAAAASGGAASGAAGTTIGSAVGSAVGAAPGGHVYLLPAEGALSDDSLSEDALSEGAPDTASAGGAAGGVPGSGPPGGEPAGPDTIVLPPARPDPGRGWRPGRLAARVRRLVTAVDFASWPSPPSALAALAGLSLGLAVLISLDSLLYLLPVIPFGAILVVGRRPQATPFLIGFIAAGVYGGLGAFLLDHTFVDTVGLTVAIAGVVAVWLLALCVIGSQLKRLAYVRRLVPRMLSKIPLRWLPEAGALLAAAVLIGFAVRPYVQTVRGHPTAAVTHFIAALQRQQGLRVDPTRTYAEQTLYWVIWYIGLPTVLLGGFGIVLLVRRCLRGLLTWRDPDGQLRMWALPLATFCAGSAAVLWQPDIVPDQPWASRRLVVLVLPGLIIGALWAASWLAVRARNRGASRATATVVGLFCSAAMLVPTLSTTFGVGLSHAGRSGGLQPVAQGMALRRTGVGQVQAVGQLCAQMPRNASVVVVDATAAEQFMQVVRGMCGVPTASMAGQPPAVVEFVVHAISAAGRQPVLLASTSARLSRFGGSPIRVLDLVTTGDPHELIQLPTAPTRVHYVLWMTSPTPAAAGT